MVSSRSDLISSTRLRMEETSVPEFVLQNEIPIDPESTLDQLTSRFRSLRDGLPELVKNSKDQYSRLGIMDKEDRQIVVILNTDALTLAVLDFAGAPAENFRGWTTWSDPTAGKADLAADIEAGHGNGGKAFMVQGATKWAFLESCFEGKRTRKGFVNDQPKLRYKPGFGLMAGVQLNDVEDQHPVERLGEVLSDLGVEAAGLPRAARELFKKRKSYTIAAMEQVAEWVGRKKQKLKKFAPQSVVEILSSHGQTAMAIETCQVWVVADGAVVSESPVRPAEIEPYPGFEQPREFDIPNVLPDPETNDAVDILKGQDGPAYLRLCTSARQLQIAQENRAKNVVRVWNHRNNIATWRLQTLHDISAASFIYGKLCCPSLVGEHLSGAERLHLSDTPLVRALEHWTREKVRDLANDLHRAMGERANPKERKRARSALSSIRSLMRRYLESDAPGSQAEGTRSGGASGKGATGQQEERGRKSLGERLDEIVLENGRADLAVISGTRVPLIFRCVELTEEGERLPVRNVQLKLVCAPEDQFSLDADGMLTALYAGIGEIWLEAMAGSTRSNHVEVWVGTANDVTWDPLGESLMQGEKKQLHFTFETPDGPLDDVLVNAEVLDPELGNIDRNGRFTAGLHEENAIVRVYFGSEKDTFRDFSIKIGPDRVPPAEGHGDRGSDVPEILFCNDEAPGMSEYPPERRTMNGGPMLPTIIEDELLFPNIVWINQNSKEAMRVRRSAGGPSGVVRVTSRTFMHFVALKCFDILKRLRVRQKIAGGTVTELQYMQYAVESEMECAEFIDAAWELSDQLLAQEEGADG